MYEKFLEMKSMSSTSVKNFQDILKKYRDFSFSERDKGARFERLMQTFLRTYPLYEGKFRHMWLWNEFPYRQDFGGKDTGIDLVAQTVEGDFWAIQCKCWDKDSYINKPAVDSFLATSSKNFVNAQAQTTSFAIRLWISTTNKWGSEAENTLQHQDPPVIRISLTTLEEAPVDWAAIESGISGEQARLSKKTLLSHQKTALEAFHEHFKTHERGKLIMACGTGKTFTSLKIAENETNGKGLVLFLVPSIALLGQTLREWTTEANTPLFPICVCSDPEVSEKKVQHDEGGYSIKDLALPASTFVPDIARQLKEARKTNGMTVVFSTYQSIDVVVEAQKAFKRSFDLIICDEAHRTTGVTLKGKEDAAFVKVHDNNFVQAKKRLYMTATPRLYNEDSKKKAKEADVYLCSMDDEAMYGEEVYRIGFGEAVDKKLLSDYKVLVLTLSENQIPEALQNAIADGTKEINTDDASKFIGCINALSKRMLVDEGLLKASDPLPMRKAVAFCQSIKISKKTTAVFNEYKDDYYNSLTPEEREDLVRVSSDHIDGTMGATLRNDKLAWLKATPADTNECRILTNVRCLSEGVDVPSLDAVMFLSARNSQVDVVQSVGRAMRVAPNKNYGYIIIPVVIPSGVSAEEALSDNERFKVVWTVLNALRAHDDRFNAMINKLELNRRKPNGGGSVIIGGIPGREDGDGLPPQGPQGGQITLPPSEIQELQNVIYARMVQKVGNKRYWEQWARDVAKIAQNYIRRINRLIAEEGKHKQAFDDFLNGLRKNINPSVDAGEVVEMLAQHMITKPVFEALFENYSFVRNNPVSQSLQKMIDILEAQALEKDALVLTRFYESVKMSVANIDNAEARQKVIVELYDKFFRTAFPDVVERLGIVYTPVEIVDFIINSVAVVLQKEFNRDLSDENVHVLDPFTGTGTFIVRMVQSGLIDKTALRRKYEREFHANEIVLLAYYIASINIENAFHDALGKTGETEYKPFDGICLTDTFQLGENDDAGVLFSELLQQNSDRVIAQQKAPIRVIIGNPPYSVGQRSANDNAQNQSYPKLEKRIAETYAKQSTATLKNSLYDSYIKAFRWASDRLDTKHGGIVAFVSNAGWIDGNAMDGFRKCLQSEFSAIYIFNLRGNCRTSGEIRRKEKDNVFGLGSRTPISITVLVKKPNHFEDAAIYYRDIGDYLTREEKLSIVAQSHDIFSPKMELTEIQPNEHGDWLNQRHDIFSSFIPLGDKDDKTNTKTVFVPYYSNGLKTQRDAWCYNFSAHVLEENIQRMLNFYNQQREEYQKQKQQTNNLNIKDFLDNNSQKISWSDGLVSNIARNEEIVFDHLNVQEAVYRPFCKHMVYFNKALNERTYQMPKLFPTPQQKNLVICVSGMGGVKQNTTLIINTIPDLNCLDAGTQCFPLYYYEKRQHQQMTLFDANEEDYIRRDGVTDFIFKQCRDRYGPKVTKEDIFYYVYGLLHSKDYREQFSEDLKKMLPRIPLVDKPADFWAFDKSGRALAELHLNYENQKPGYSIVVTGETSEDFRVDKMRFIEKDDKTGIRYNSRVTITNIPFVAYDYVVNGKSVIEWIMERYQVTVDKASQIKNDPNDWAKEHNNPRYILDLLLSVIMVSIETVRIVEGLPGLGV
ncbi:MAG: DEAD/DEAH box helicase family protein [Synergistaceae bacterium]|nr:DEAD/DEAH box helicase family protein [Synergistaceae bacterium]